MVIYKIKGNEDKTKQLCPRVGQQLQTRETLKRKAKGNEKTEGKVGVFLFSKRMNKIEHTLVYITSYLTPSL